MIQATLAATESDPKTERRSTLLLVDGFGLIFRAFFALDKSVSSLATSAGEPTGAVYGFATMLLDVLRNERPDYAIVALEGGRTFRHEAFTDYKAHRAEMPEDLRRQLSRVREFIDALGVPVMVREGYEADDVIGSLATQCGKRDNVRVIVVTGDSDLLQLVDDDVEVILPGTRRFGELRRYDRAAVYDRYSFGPEHVADYKALVGDTSDNIPGVPGIGEKTAKALINQFGSIESIFDHLDEVTPPRARAALEGNREQALAGKHLTQIVRDLDVPLDKESAAVGNYDREKVVNLLRELEFRALLNKLPDVSTTEAAPPLVERVVAHRTLVASHESLDELVAALRAADRYAIDVETTSTEPLEARLVGIAIATSPEKSYYVPVGHDEGDQLTLDEVRTALSPILADDSKKSIAHHGKYDELVLLEHGYPLNHISEDSMIAAFVLNENSLGLKNLAFSRLGWEMTDIGELIGTGRNQMTMNLVDVAQVTDYACADVEATISLADYFSPLLKERDQEQIYREIELPLIPVLVDMERAGVAIDTAYLAEFSVEITARIKDLEQEIYALAGREFNIGSIRQMAQILFEELKLPSGRRTKTGFSVDSDVLESLRSRHPIVELILEYRTLGKLKSTYVDALPNAVNERTGRVHTSYNQTIAATGRLSSINPNLQNIPVRTEVGRRVRHAFVADHRPEHRLVDDAVLVAADYSQIELRLLAHMSGEPFLVEAFKSGQDIHAATAQLVYGVGPGEVTSDMRRVAKTVNFGVMYGMQAYGLSRDSGLSRADAQKFIDDYWARLPRVRALFDETLAFGAAHGYVRSPSGRRRYLPDLTSSNGARRQGAERMAINMPVQGTAADVIKIAMVRLHAALKESGLRAKMLLQVHDELVLEVDRPHVEDAARLMVEVMENAYPMSVPLVAEVQSGQRWDELEELVLGQKA